jgi:alpha-beta hydrolase superfamily lysophospholipase
LAVLAACAHTPDLPLRPDPSPPPGSTAWTFEARDHTPLLARTWAATTTPRGVVVIMHGLKDYSGRYARLASKLAARGYIVYAFDLRGHGRSAGPRVAPEHWTDYVDDLDRFLTEVADRAPNQPIFLFGHSMGGAIAARAAEIHQPKLAGLVLSGAALAVAAPPLLIAATRMTGFLVPKAPALSLPNKDFSSDPAHAAVMDHDELISQPAGPASTAAGLVEGMRAIWADTGALTMPVLAMHGTADKLTAPSGSRALIAAIPSTDKTLEIYDGYYHDLVHEPGDRGPKVEDAIVAWLDAHTGGPAIAAPPPYTGHLTGDPKGWLQTIELGGGIGARQEAGSSITGAFDGDAAFGLPRPVGWFGDVSERIAPDVSSLALRPVGIAVHDGALALGVDGGVSLLAMDHGAWSVSARAEAPLGFAHLGIAAEWDRWFSGNDANRTLGSDGLWLGGVLRFGGDRSYWPHAHAGVGPALLGGLDWGEQGRGWFLLAGLELFGAD